MKYVQTLQLHPGTGGRRHVGGGTAGQRAACALTGDHTHPPEYETPSLLPATTPALSPRAVVPKAPDLPPLQTLASAAPDGGTFTRALPTPVPRKGPPPQEASWPRCQTVQTPATWPLTQLSAKAAARHLSRRSQGGPCVCQGLRAFREGAKAMLGRAGWPAWDI